MENQDIRWHQRLSSYKKAFAQLEKAVVLYHERKLSELEEQGLIQAFEFTHELAWNVMKDYFNFQGNNTITGSRDATKEAFRNGLIVSGDHWMEMIISRNKTSHTYDAATAEEISEIVADKYFKLFEDFLSKMENLRHDEQTSMF